MLVSAAAFCHDKGELMRTQALTQKIDRIRRAVAFAPTDRTPLISDFYTWKIFDSELDISFRDAIFDFKKMEKIVCEFHERYGFDAYTDLGSRNPMRLSTAMGEGSNYIFIEESSTINVVDKVLMEPEEYEAYAADVSGFRKKIFARKYPHATAAKVHSAMQEMLNYAQFIDRMESVMNRKYATPALLKVSAASLVPIEDFASYTRGLKNIAIDMRRRPDALQAALDAHWAAITWPGALSSLDADTSGVPFDAYTSVLAHTVMSPRQFDRFYWPYLKKLIDEVDRRKTKNLYIYCEGSMQLLVPYLQDCRRGLVCLHPERETPYTVRELLPDVCVAGGLTCHQLYSGTPEACVTEAQRLIDTLGDGFIMGQEKMISFPNDCRRENLLALCAFVKGYRHGGERK